MKRTSVGYCHVDEGCKYAAKNLQSANGIARSPINDTFYVGSALGGGLYILEKQTDNTLVLTDVLSPRTSIPNRWYPFKFNLFAGMSFDNLAIDSNGALWIACTCSFFQTHMTYNPDIQIPCSLPLPLSTTSAFQRSGEPRSRQRCSSSDPKHGAECILRREVQARQGKSLLFNPSLSSP